METAQIINWILDKAARAQHHSYVRMLNLTASRLRELEEKQRWIPVTERLPERGQEVLVYAGDGHKPEVYAYSFWHKDFASFSRITHWLPLPEPPEK